MKKPILLGIGVIVVLIIVTGAYKKIDLSKFNSSLKSTSAEIGIEAAKTKTVDFVQNYLVQSGTEVTLKNATEENGLYAITLLIGQQEIAAYMTKDGTKFFPQVMDIAEIEKQAEEQKKKDAAALKDMPKTDKPTVDLYVMSFCPFGNKAEDTLASAYALLKDKVNFNFHYIVSSDGDTIQSLHGQKEVDQDEREMCVMKNYGEDKWMNFVAYVNDKCGSDGSCWEDGAKSLGLDAEKISSCVSSEGTALMKNEEKVSQEANASGSPTMVINGVTSKIVYQYGNSEAYKQAICSAFNEVPVECSQQLSSETSTSAGGSCN